MKVLVIGGGASGLTAALTASEDPHSDVHLAERQARVARKLLATGNGRCNLTNRDMDLSHYHGTAPQFCLPRWRPSAWSRRWRGSAPWAF